MYHSQILYYTIQPGDSVWQLAQRFHTTVQRIQELNPQINVNLLQAGRTILIQPGSKSYGNKPYCISPAGLEIMNEMRKLWEQHSVWTRSAINSIVFSLPNEDLVIQRLLRNPDDFANALKPFYGSLNASKFGELLKEHLVIAAELVKAAKAGNNEKAADAEKRWYANADAIAAFLGRINPYWSEENWRTMMHEHLRLVKAEAVTLLQKDYKGNIDIYDEIEDQALMMADTLAIGIIRQFPSLFQHIF